MLGEAQPTAADAFRSKLDLFMSRYVTPEFDPARIVWWLSLSGGKDSYAMATGLRQWYLGRAIPFTAKVFTIDQWGGPAATALSRQITWTEVQIVDGRSLTLHRTRYQPGEQAPCRKCADVRRDVSDELIRSAGISPDRVNFVARGLHLSDTAVSALWRFVMGRNPASDMIDSGKAKPLAYLSQQVYLAKPLCFVREYESQSFALANGFQPACCGCPACQYPSRRDIVEETVLELYRGPFWEFDIPGVVDLLDNRGGRGTALEVRRLSAPGIEKKKPHLPPGFPRFAAQFHRRALRRDVLHQVAHEFDSGRCLDDLGFRRLFGRQSAIEVDRIPMPSLIGADELTGEQELMVAALGPFWGALALDPNAAKSAYLLQERIFGFGVDEQWSHITPILREFYGASNGTHTPTKKLALRTVSCASSCFSGA